MRLSVIYSIRGLVLGFCLWTTIAVADTQAPVKIGILSFRSIENTTQQWQGLAEYLQQSMPERQFQIIPLYYPDLNKATTSGHLDFVLTNPEHYVILRQSTGMSAIATLMPLAKDHSVNQFGGVVIVAAQRSDIRTLGNLADKVVASPDPESFGGFIMQAWELYKQGVRVKRYLYTGMPHDNVVAMVLRGEADAGFVRTGVLESMLGEGKIAEGSIKVINQQPVADFPYLVSTGLYPEWPFAASKQTDPVLVKKVTLALLNLDNQSPLSQSARIFGFSPPGDYSKVEAVMLNLNVHPQALKNINLGDLYYSYRQPIWVALVSLIVILLLSLKLLRVHRHLRRAFLKYHLVADYTSDWEYWLGPAGEVVYMSPSCQGVTGYPAHAFKHRPELLEQIIHPQDKAVFSQHWQSGDRKQFGGEIEFRIVDKRNNLRWIHHLCRPVFDERQRYQGIRVSNRDITQRKQIELELRLHDAALKACADAIIITDADGVIKWVNPAFCDLSGYAEAEILGKKPADLIKSGQQDGEFYQRLWLTIKAGKSWRGEVINRRKNGEQYFEQLSITPVLCDNEDVCHFIAVKQDISERKRIEQQIHRLAFYDPLTHLANRRLLVDRLEHAISGCRRYRQYGALLFIDLDLFKPLNDKYGHDVGDALLVEVANRLKASVREQDTVARLGGDEFVVLIIELDGDAALAGQQAQAIAEKIHGALGRSYTLTIDAQSLGASIDYQLSASVGISLFIDVEDSAEKILKQADIAMYEAKHQGRNTIRLYG